MDTDRRPRAQRTGVVAVAAALVVFVLLIGTLGSGPIGPRPAGASAPTIAAGDNQPCLDNVGITVVVDFRELGGGVNVRCAPGPVTDGFDALTKAGINFQTAVRQAGFLCRIAGKPSDDPCINTSPADAYWSYWIAPRGGQWCYSNVGAGARTRPLPPGSVEGWSFSKNKQSTTNSPPQYVPPAAIPGEAPNPIPASDCDGAVPPPPDPPVTTPTTSGGPTPTVPGSANGGGSAGEPTGPGASGVDSSDAGAGGDSSTTTSPADAQVDDDGTSDEVALGLVSTNDDGSTQALGDVDLASDGSSGGSPVALALAGFAVVGLGLGGVWIARRRRAIGSG